MYDLFIITNGILAAHGNRILRDTNYYYTSLIHDEYISKIYRAYLEGLSVLH